MLLKSIVGLINIDEGEILFDKKKYEAVKLFGDKTAATGDRNGFPGWRAF